MANFLFLTTSAHILCAINRIAIADQASWIATKILGFWFTISHKFWIGLSSGDCAGHTMTIISLSFNQFFTSFEVCFILIMLEYPIVQHFLSGMWQHNILQNMFIHVLIHYTYHRFNGNFVPKSNLTPSHEPLHAQQYLDSKDPTLIGRPMYTSHFIWIYHIELWFVWK